MKALALLIAATAVDNFYVLGPLMGATPRDFGRGFERLYGSSENVSYAGCVVKDTPLGKDDRMEEVYLFLSRPTSELTIVFYYRSDDVVGNNGTVYVKDGAITNVEPSNGGNGTAEEMRMLAHSLLSQPMQRYNAAWAFSVKPQMQCGFDASDYFQTPALPAKPLG